MKKKDKEGKEEQRRAEGQKQEETKEWILKNTKKFCPKICPVSRRYRI